MGAEHFTSMRSYLVVLLAPLWVCEAAYPVEGKITNVQEPWNMRVQLRGNEGQYDAIPNIDGSFIIRDVPAGAFLLDVHSIRYNFTTMRVDVSAVHHGKVAVRAMDDLSSFLDYPLELAPNGFQYFVLKRKPYDFSGTLRTLLIFGGGGVLLIFLFRNTDAASLQEALQTLQEDDKSRKP